MSEDNLLSAALELAEQGVAVFPVGLDKRPRNSNGFHGATTDPEQISKWNWAGGAIGTTIPEGHFVIDIDPRNGGDQTIKVLLSAGRALPATKVVATQSGGSHRYYKIPDGLDVAKLRGTLGPGVDIKASGKGYVLAPPSPGYELKHNYVVAEAPGWVMEEIGVSHADAAPGQASEAKFFPFENGTAYGLTAFQMEIDELTSVGEGGRNNALNKSAFSLAQLVAGGELSEEYALDALKKAADQIGLPPDEASQTLKSGWNAGFEEPRQSPTNDLPDESELEMVEDDEDEFDVEAEFWTDYEGMEDPGPPKYYLFPLIPKNAYLLVYGPTEASKSMVFLALAAEGSHKGVKTDIYSLENPPHIDVDRIRRWKPDPDNLRVSHQLMDLNDPRQVAALIRRSNAHGTHIIMLDTYSHAFNFKSDDGNAKAIHFAKIIRHILKEVDCTVIVVDHTGYSAHGEPRDASAKRQAVDMSIKMERPAGFEWKPKQPAVFRMDNTKSARFGNPFEMIGRIKDVPGDTRDLELEWDRQFAKPGWRVDDVD